MDTNHTNDTNEDAANIEQDNNVSEAEEKGFIQSNLKYIYFAMAALIILLSLATFIVRRVHHHANIDAVELASAAKLKTKKIQKKNPAVFTDSDKKAVASIQHILARMQTMSGKIQALNDSISVIKSRLDDMNKSIESNQQLADKATHLQANLGGIYTRLDATDKKLNHLNQVLLKAKKIKAARAKRAYKRRLKLAHLKPPFTLVNTQFWGGAMIANIKNAQSTWAVKKDNIINGWMIRSISSRCITTESMRYHKIVHLCQ